LMRTKGYEIKEGQRISFRAPGQTRFTRLDTLRGDHTPQAILERIEGKRVVVPKQSAAAPVTEKTAARSNEPKVNLLIDIQNSIKAQNSPGYEHWAKLFNVKQMARTLLFLQENDLTDYNKLTEVTAEATEKFNEISEKIKATEARMNEISELQKNISNYSRTKDIYVQYRESGYSKKFLAANEGDIIIHQAAKKFFDKQNVKKLTSIKALKTEYATLLADKKKMYAEYKEAKQKMQDLANAKQNTDRLLGYNGKLAKDENERTVR